MSGHETARPALDPAPLAVAPTTTTLAVGLAGLAVCGLGAYFDIRQFERSYLAAYLFWVGIALGSLGLLMLHQLVGGDWGYVIRRPLESAVATLPLMAVLFIPIALGMAHLYEWAEPSNLAVLAKRAKYARYLNPNAYLIRAVGYFAIWSILGFVLVRWTGQKDRSDDPAAYEGRLQALSGPCLVALFLSLTFAMIDWVMSLEPHWYSTIFGAMIAVGMALSSFAFTIVVATRLDRAGATDGLTTSGRLRDLGNLLLAFVMLWAYFSFSQFLIIWSGNLAEEVPWYLRRTRGGWEYVAVALVVFHFFLPFGALLFKEVKGKSWNLGLVAALVLTFQFINDYWLVMPASGGPLRPHWLDAAAVAGVGGIWLAAFGRNLGRRPLVPRHTPAEHGHGHANPVEHDQHARA